MVNGTRPGFMARMVMAALCWMVVASWAPAHGQEIASPSATPTTRLDAAKSTLDSIEAQLTRSNLSDTTLQQLRSEVDKPALDLQGVVTELQPRADAAKARLEQLGPKPDPKAPNAAPEAADITAERGAQEKLFNDLDATIKRAKVLQVQATQVDGIIGSLRRSLFTRSVLARSYSLVDPRLWVPVVAELPSDGRALQFLVGDWYSAVLSKLPGWQLALFCVAVLLVVGGYEPAQRVARRVAGRDAVEKPPTRLRQALAAAWTVVLTVAVPAAGLAILALLSVALGLVPTRLAPLFEVFTRNVLGLALIVGLARGYVAPRRKVWRLPLISDRGAESIYGMTLWVASLVAIASVVDTLNDTISVGLPTTIASKGLLTALAAGTIAVVLKRLSTEDPEMATAAAARRARGRDWAGLLRMILWGLTALVAGALLVGYVAFANFLLVQMAVCTGIGLALALLLTLVDEGITALFGPTRATGRLLAHTVGLRRDSIDILVILLVGFLRVTLIGSAVLLALAPWRIESGDMLAVAQAAFFGFSIGDVTISPSGIVIAAVLFVTIVAMTHAVQRWLDGTLLPKTRLDAGLQNSIRTSFGYIGVLVATAIGLSQLGVSFERLAIVAGALSVGIGFGLQSIVNNFVSGLILLWERVIRVGDWVMVGSDQGYVRRINVRSTEIETFDRSTVIVPNSNLVSGVVTNWLRNDRVGRIRLSFTLGYNAKAEDVRALMVEEAKAHDHVLTIPSPHVLLTEVGESSMKMTLVCYLEDVEASQRTTSDLNFAILARLQSIGLLQPAGPPTMSIPELDKLDAWLERRLHDVAPRQGSAPQA